MQRKQQIIQSKRKQPDKSKYSYWKIAGIILLVILSLGTILVLVNRSNRRDNLSLPTTNENGKVYLPKNRNSCNTNFIAEKFNTQKQNKGSIQTVMIQEVHAKDEMNIADCLEEMISPDDRLLIEAPDDNGKALPCGSVHPVYKHFDGKVKCFGFDVPLSEDRLRYVEFSWRTNFIEEKIVPWVLEKAKTASDVVRYVNHVADFFDQLPDDKEGLSSNLNINHNQRKAKYLRERIAKKITEMNLDEVIQFLVKENNQMGERAMEYQARTRETVANDALIKQIQHHKTELKNSGTDGRLFVVAGAHHLDPDKNKKLQKVIDQGDEITLLKTKSTP